MQTHDTHLSLEEITVFICVNERPNKEMPGCAKAFDFTSFKEVKFSFFQEFGPTVKLVATKCQGVCPKDAFYATLIQPKREHKTKQYVLENKQELQTLIKEELQEILR